MVRIVTQSPESFQSQIMQLDVGESVVKATRFDLDTVTEELLRTARQRYRNTYTTAIDRAKKKSGNVTDFDMELGSFLTQSNHLMLVLVITRTA